MVKKGKMKTEVRDIFEIAKDLRDIKDEEKRNEIIFYIQSLHQKIANLDSLMRNILSNIERHYI